MRSGTGWGRGSRITTGSGTLQTHPAAVSATTRTRPTSATSTVFIGGPLLERPGDLGAEGGARRRLRDGNPTEREREKSDAEGDDLVPLGAGFDACHFRALPKLEDGRRKARALRRFAQDRKSTRLNSSHVAISYAVFCLKKKNISFIRSTTFATSIFPTPAAPLMRIVLHS